MQSKIQQYLLLFFFFILLNGLSAQESQTDNDNRIYTVVEHSPTFGDGTRDAPLKYLLQNLKYPSKEELIEIGRIVVGFIVEKDGTLSNIKMLNGKENTALGKEVIRVVKTMSPWTSPGYQRGEAVRVQYTLPISIRFAE